MHSLSSTISSLALKRNHFHISVQFLPIALYSTLLHQNTMHSYVMITRGKKLLPFLFFSPDSFETITIFVIVILPPCQANSSVPSFCVT